MNYCSQEKGTGALMLLGEGNWCATVLKEKETGAPLLMFLLGEGNWYCIKFTG